MTGVAAAAAAAAAAAVEEAEITKVDERPIRVSDVSTSRVSSDGSNAAPAAEPFSPLGSAFPSRGGSALRVVSLSPESAAGRAAAVEAATESGERPRSLSSSSMGGAGAAEARGGLLALRAQGGSRRALGVLDDMQVGLGPEKEIEEGGGTDLFPDTNIEKRKRRVIPKLSGRMEQIFV